MTSLGCFLLLAQASSRVPKPGDWQFGWSSVAMVAAGAIATIFVAWLISRLLATRQRRISDSPWCLFKEVCTAHGLNHRERQLLTRLAQQFRLEQPTALFIEPAWWEAEQLGPAWTRCRPELEKLRRRLFTAR